MPPTPQNKGRLIHHHTLGPTFVLVNMEKILKGLIQMKNLRVIVILCCYVLCIFIL